MIDLITALYCIVDNLLEATGHTAYARSEMSGAEVIIAALCAAFDFGGNLERRRPFMRETDAQAH